MPVRPSRGPDLDEDDDRGEDGDSDSEAENASSVRVFILNSYLMNPYSILFC